MNHSKFTKRKTKCGQCYSPHHNSSQCDSRKYCSNCNNKSHDTYYCKFKNSTRPSCGNNRGAPLDVPTITIVRHIATKTIAIIIEITIVAIGPGATMEVVVGIILLAAPPAGIIARWATLLRGKTEDIIMSTMEYNSLIMWIIMMDTIIRTNKRIIIFSSNQM